MAASCGMPGRPPSAMLLGQLAHPWARMTSDLRSAEPNETTRKVAWPMIPGRAAARIEADCAR